MSGMFPLGRFLDSPASGACFIVRADGPSRAGMALTTCGFDLLSRSTSCESVSLFPGQVASDKEHHYLWWGYTWAITLYNYVLKVLTYVSLNKQGVWAPYGCKLLISIILPLQCGHKSLNSYNVSLKRCILHIWGKIKAHFQLAKVKILRWMRLTHFSNGFKDNLLFFPY